MGLVHPRCANEAPMPPTAPSAGLAAATHDATRSLLSGRTSEQQQAIIHGAGPLLIFAGPGAGKTATLTRRIGYLLATGQAAPMQILAVTFTVAAAGEMRLRLMELLGEETCRRITVATFHSVCARIVRTHAAIFGRSDDFTIYDQVEVKKVVDHLLSDHERATIQHELARFGEVPAQELLKEISLAKNRLWTPAFLETHSEHPLAPLIACVWREVEEELRQSNALDFDDLLVCAVRLLADHPDLLVQYRQRWPWMLVDEFQDTNYAQMALVRLVAGPHGNLTVVADDDQAIYGFRGAEPDNVLRFREHFPAAQTVTLGINFRSSAEIVVAASQSIAHNTVRVAKRLLAHNGPGGRVECLQFPDDRHEAHWICGQVGEALTAGVSPGEIMLIARTSFATMALQHALASHGIAHRVLGSLGLYERAEVKDAIAYLQLLANPHDAQSFRRAISSPKRGVGAATASRIIEAARRDGLDLISCCVHVERLDEIRNNTTREHIALFGRELDRIRHELTAGRSIGHSVVETVMLDGGVVAHHQRRRDAPDVSTEERRDAERVLEDLRSLCRAAASYEEQVEEPSLGGFLDQACGLDGAEVVEGEDQRITISTIHRAKGTEASFVVVVGCEEGVLPSWRAIEDGDPVALEEERRLFYVAGTRAKHRLVFTVAARRGERDSDGPSRFLAEAGLQPA